MDITVTGCILTFAAVYMLVTPCTITTNNFLSHMIYKLVPIVIAGALGILAALEFGMMVAP